MPNANNRPGEWSKDKRLPLWNDSDRLLRLGAKNCLTDFAEQHAVVLTSDEVSTFRDNRGNFVNHYFMRAGSAQRLADCWQDFFDEVDRIYGFSDFHDWGRQRNGLQSLFRKFFNQRRMDIVFGWVALLTMQRPQHLRCWEDSRITLSSSICKTSHGKLGLLLKQPVGLTRLRFRPDRLLFAYDGLQYKQRCRSLTFRRQLSVEGISNNPTYFSERRFVMALDGKHDEILASGKTPAVLLNRRTSCDTIGVNGYLNLVAITQDSSGQFKFCNNTLEIDPVSGRIATIRCFEVPMWVGLLSASVVEHEVLSKLLSSVGDA